MIEIWRQDSMNDENNGQRMAPTGGLGLIGQLMVQM